MCQQGWWVGVECLVLFGFGIVFLFCLWSDKTKRGRVLVLTHRDCRVALPNVGALCHCSWSPGKCQASASNPRAPWWYQASSRMSGLQLFLVNLGKVLNIFELWFPHM